jgi:hypothetical protein
MQGFLSATWCGLALYFDEILLSLLIVYVCWLLPVLNDSLFLGFLFKGISTAAVPCPEKTSADPDLAAMVAAEGGVDPQREQAVVAAVRGRRAVGMERGVRVSGMGWGWVEPTRHCFYNLGHNLGNISWA